MDACSKLAAGWTRFYRALMAAIDPAWRSLGDVWTTKVPKEASSLRSFFLKSIISVLFQYSLFSSLYLFGLIHCYWPFDFFFFLFSYFIFNLHHQMLHLSSLPSAQNGWHQPSFFSYTIHVHACRELCGCLHIVSTEAAGPDPSWQTKPAFCGNLLTG